MVAFTLWWQSWVVAKEAVWPTTSRYLQVDPFLAGSTVLDSDGHGWNSHHKQLTQPLASVSSLTKWWKNHLPCRAVWFHKNGIIKNRQESYSRWQKLGVTIFFQLKHILKFIFVIRSKIMKKLNCTEQYTKDWLNDHSVRPQDKV